MYFIIYYAVTKFKKIIKMKYNYNFHIFSIYKIIMKKYKIYEKKFYFHNFDIKIHILILIYYLKIKKIIVIV